MNKILEHTKYAVASGVVLLGFATNVFAGHAVVCFSISPKYAVNFGGTLTPQGQSSITSATSYEYYRVTSVADKNPLIIKMNQQNYQDATETLRGELKKAPDLYEADKRYFQKLGWIQDGIPVPQGFEDPHYFKSEVGVPTNCAVIPVVQKEHGTYLFNSSVWAHLPDTQKAILQVQSEIEEIGTEDRYGVKLPCDPPEGPSLCNRINPSSVSLLLLSILARPISEEELVTKLRRYKFGEFYTRAMTLSARDFLLQKYQVIEPELNKIVSFCQSHIGTVADTYIAYKKISAQTTEITNWFYDEVRNPGRIPPLAPVDDAYSCTSYMGQLNKASFLSETFQCPEGTLVGDVDRCFVRTLRGLKELQ